MSEKFRFGLNSKEKRKEQKREWKKRKREKKIEERRREKMWRHIEGSPLESVSKDDGKVEEIGEEIHERSEPRAREYNTISLPAPNGASSSSNEKVVAKCQNVTAREQPHKRKAETDVLDPLDSNPDPNQEQRKLLKVHVDGKDTEISDNHGHKASLEPRARKEGNKEAFAASLCQTVGKIVVKNSVSRGKIMIALARQKQKCRQQSVASARPKLPTSKLNHEATGKNDSGNTPLREINRSLIYRISDIPIGCGTFGNCFIARYRGIKVVVKEIKTRGNNKEDKQRCKREALHEASVLNKLGDHPGLALLFGVCSTTEPYAIVLQFHGKENESLTLQKAAQKKLLNKSSTIVVFKDICSALKYIHCKGYLHNDLKANNVLLEHNEKDCQFEPKIIDFGKSRPIDTVRKGRQYSSSYLAPEVRSGQGQTTASDVFSLGKMLDAVVSKRSFAGSFSHIVKQTTAPSRSDRPCTDEILVLLAKLE